MARRSSSPSPYSFKAWQRKGRQLARQIRQAFWLNVRVNIQGVEPGLNGTVSLLRRRWKVIAAVALPVILLGALLMALSPREYTAQTLLQLNTRQEQVTNIADVVSGISGGDAAIRTEVDVLTSRRLARRVIEELDLLNEPAFAEDNSLPNSIKHMIKQALGTLDVTQDAEETVKATPARMTGAINRFLGNLQVSQTPRSYSITLRYTASTPKLAADITNALADAYLTSQLEDKFDATRRANAWMSERLKQLQKSVQQADYAVRKFREDNGLTQAQGVTLTEQQLSELNSQLILARTQLAEAEAKASSTARGGNTASEVVNSPLIQNLRLQEAEVRRSIGELSARYGDLHPRMQAVRNELTTIQGRINEETRKIRSSMGNDLVMARARVSTLEQQLNALQSKNRLSTSAEVQLAELQRQAQAEKSLYESFLARSREIAQMDFVQTDARVIYPAEAPLSPSSPKTMLGMALAVMAGLGLGVGLALLLEMLDSGVRTLQQLERLARNATGGNVRIPALGMVPELPAGAVNLAKYVLEKPTSAYAESVRGLRTMLMFTQPDQPPQVINVTSSVPQEGKSLFALTLAQVAAMGGQKVLLVDADLRRPNQCHQLKLNAKAGLAEVLTGQAKLKDVLIDIPGTQLTLLPALPGNTFAQELFASRKMADLMQQLRKDFQQIVIDGPPVMAVADAITLSPHADATLFMTRWGMTPRPLIENALQQLLGCGVKVSGMVLTRVDMDQQQSYGYGDFGFYYSRYKDYYTD